jgi:hypothetical protein
MYKRLIAGLVRDLVQRVENLLNHPSPVQPVQYLEALTRTHTCLVHTLTQLNHIYRNHVLLPEAAYWINSANMEKEVQTKASAAITLWILVGGCSPPQQTGSACVQV